LLSESYGISISSVRCENSGVAGGSDNEIVNCLFDSFCDLVAANRAPTVVESDLKMGDARTSALSSRHVFEDSPCATENRLSLVGHPTLDFTGELKTQQNPLHKE
jgi:hypothetical protein